MFKTLLQRLARLAWKIEWAWDYYFAYFLYNERKLHRYHKIMERKWRDKHA